MAGNPASSAAASAASSASSCGANRPPTYPSTAAQVSALLIRTILAEGAAASMRGTRA